MSTQSTPAALSMFPQFCQAQGLGSCHRNIPQGKLHSVAVLPRLCTGNRLSCFCLLHVHLHCGGKSASRALASCHRSDACEGKPLQIPDNACRSEKPPPRWLTYTPEAWECQGNGSLHGTQMLRRRGAAPHPRGISFRCWNK